MKPHNNQITRHWLAASLVLACFLVSAHGAPATSPAPAASTNAVALPEVPQSIFAIPSSAKEGRNPFFPNATQPVAPGPGPKVTGGVDPTLFVLNGITSPPKRTAMINGRTFEPGESGEVKLPNGAKVLLKCEEIRDDSIIIDIDGAHRELRFRSKL